MPWATAYWTTANRCFTRSRYCEGIAIAFMSLLSCRPMLAGKGPILSEIFHPGDTGDSGPRGPGSAQAHFGADLRGGLSRGVVWLSPEADGAPGGGAGDEGHSGKQDAGDRPGFGGVLRHRAARSAARPGGAAG